jgi:isopenicillin N synthase-like dioxygenase
MASIPCVDLLADQHPGLEARLRIAQELHQALTTVGFAYIVGHGVPQSLIDEAFDASKRFHASSLEQKQRLAINAQHRGYMGMATSTIVTSSVANVRRPNLSESLMLMHELAPDDPDVLAGKPLQGPNQWPDWLPDFKPTLTRYVDAVEQAARRIIHTIALSLDLPETALDPYFARPTTFLRLLHYPPQPPHADHDQFGSAPHTDYGIITVLAQDATGGLQVRPRGQSDWIDAPPIPGSYVLNVADMLARWTNDRFVSTPHRVINRSGLERYSIPFFFDTGMDARIECLSTCVTPERPARYEPVRYGDYLMERLNRNYEYRKPSET